MDNKRNRREWQDAILMIIKNYEGEANYSHFYADIPKIFVLTERELRPSSEKANFELVWRGTLRGYLCDLVQQGILTKTGKRKSPVFRAR